jgi:hypothetical protein
MFMRKYHLTIFSLLVTVFFSACGNKDDDGFPMNKKYWTPEDYSAVNTELTSLKYNNKELPNLDNPKTAAVFEKIVDTTNITVVANDEQLGLEHRKEFTSNLFDQYRQLADAYEGTDRTDKYQYPVEVVQIANFGLCLQIYYIQTNNQSILKTADNPNSSEVVDIVRRNKNILVRNYDLYLEYMNYEDRFSEKALQAYADGLKRFFPRLINNVAPDGDYSAMQDRVNNMLKKIKNEEVKNELQNISAMLTAKTQHEEK